MKKSIKRKIIREIKNQYPQLNFKQRLSLLAFIERVDQGDFFPRSTLAKMGEELAHQMGIFELRQIKCPCGDPQCVDLIPAGELADLYNSIIYG